MRRDVEFPSQGTICRGWLYTPDVTRGSSHPTVVMAHGFSAVKEMRLDRFAETFAEGGLASLVFDYRGLGTSDGLPRQDLDPHAQIEDYRNAISYARTLPEVDRDKIGIWGTSFSGGHVLMVAAFDKRVKAVVSQVPLIDGWDVMGEETRNLMIQRQIAERERTYAGGAPTMIPVVDNSGLAAAIGDPDAWDWFQMAAKVAPTWRNEVTFRTLERLLCHSPGRFIDRTAPASLLMIAAEHDVLRLDIAQSAFARAGEPKKFLTIPAGHFAPYEPPHFTFASRAAAEWFATHLR